MKAFEDLKDYGVEDEEPAAFASWRRQGPCWRKWAQEVMAAIQNRQARLEAKAASGTLRKLFSGKMPPDRNGSSGRMTGPQNLQPENLGACGEKE